MPKTQRGRDPHPSSFSLHPSSFASQPCAALARLAEEDPSLAEAAAIQSALLRAAVEGPPLMAQVALDPERAAAKLAAGVPLLRGEELRLDPVALSRMFGRLAEAAARARAYGAEAVAAAHRHGRLDAAALARATLAGEADIVARRAAELELPADLLGTLLRFSLFGPLSDLAARLAPLREGRGWDEGYCPTCGGWPLLAEQRGLEQLRFLRCGICATGWQVNRLRCVFCGTREHEQLSYLFVDGQDSRRAAACAECRGYLKVLNTLAPIPPYELPVHDLATLHLDLAALERGYAPA